MRITLQAMVAAAAAVLLCPTAGIAHADRAPAPDPGQCRAVALPAPQMHATMSASLCLPRTQTDLVLVLMPGSDYNHAYWDFPYRPETYSFRRAMNAAGYATLVVDRPGIGASTRPSSTLVDSTADAQALHDTVGALRRGLAGAHPFRKVVIGGHSLSSGIDIMEETTYHDVDGLLLTGFSHALNVPGALGIVAGYYPADQDPRFRGRGYDTGYLTTRPGTRTADFFAVDDVEPGVLAADEATKDVFAATEYPDGLMSTLPPMTNRITAPVLVVNGSRDRLCAQACADTATLAAEEAPFFAPAAKLRAYVLPHSGHAVNLARNTAEYQAAVADWLRTTIE